MQTCVKLLKEYTGPVEEGDAEGDGEAEGEHPQSMS